MSLIEDIRKVIDRETEVDTYRPANLKELFERIPRERFVEYIGNAIYKDGVAEIGIDPIVLSRRDYAVFDDGEKIVLSKPYEEVFLKWLEEANIKYRTIGYPDDPCYKERPYIVVIDKDAIL